MMGGGGEGISYHLASQTGLTDGIRLGRRGDLGTSNQVVLDHLFEDRIAGVTEVLMPEGEIHGKGGGRRKVGCLWDEDGGALKIGSGGGIHLGLKHSGAMRVGERKCVLFDGNEKVSMHGEEENRKEIAP